MKLLLRLVCLSLAVLVMDSSPTSAREVLKIHVSILPQKYFVDRIAKDLVKVDVLVKPGKSPATYSPTPAQIKTLSQADLYFRIGVSFENGFLHKIGSIAPNIRLVDCRKGIRLRQMQVHVHEEDENAHIAEHHEGEHHEEEHHEEEHHEGEDHDHTGKDPHIWMSPDLVKIQAKTILEALVALDPDHQVTYKDNYTAFIQDLDHLNTRLIQILSPYKGENLFVFHSAFGYFADAFGMHQVAVETMGKSPKGKDLSAIIKLARKEKARVIFVQPQFDKNAAEKIALAIKGHVVSMNPLAYDYLANMETMANTIAQNMNP
jgi:zinc transport system substrate-binding protein